MWERESENEIYRLTDINIDRQTNDHTSCTKQSHFAYLCLEEWVRDRESMCGRERERERHTDRQIERKREIETKCEKHDKYWNN